MHVYVYVCVLQIKDLLWRILFADTLLTYLTYYKKKLTIIHKNRDSQTERARDREIKTRRQRPTKKQTDRQRDRGRSTDRQMPTDRQTDGQRDQQTDID